MLKITTNFSPIRLIEGQTDPIILNIYLRNDEEESKLVSLMVKIPFYLGFDKAGLSRENRKRIGYVKPETEKAIPVMLYPKHSINEGLYPIEIKIREHLDRYDITEKEYSVKTEVLSLLSGFGSRLQQCPNSSISML